MNNISRGFNKIFIISKFSGMDSIIKFKEEFDLVSNIEEINLFLREVEEDNENFLDTVLFFDNYANHLDLLVASLASNSYKSSAYELQKHLITLRNYIDLIPRNRGDFSKFVKIIERESLDTESSIGDFIIKNDAQNENLLEILPDNLDKTDNSGASGDVESDSRDNSIEKIAKVTKTNFLKRTQIDKNEIQQRIIFRNSLIQTLIDIYHEKKNGYKLMVGLFRGLDVFRRMSLSRENFDKRLFMRNFRKYISYYQDANLIELCHENNPALGKEDISKYIVDCLKIINKQIDKSRFKIYFDNKLNFRSGFNYEFQQRVEWLYYPEKRRPARNIDELYTIKSVTLDSSKEMKYNVNSYKSYISLLSKRDINIVNQILPKMHTLYYKKNEFKKFLIKIFYSLDNYEYSFYEMSEEQKNRFKDNFNKIILNENKNNNYPNLCERMIELNSKLRPEDIKNLLPTCVKIMKEKIDIGYERIKRRNPHLNNSFNPLEKYRQIYDKKNFIIYKRV